MASFMPRTIMHGAAVAQVAAALADHLQTFHGLIIARTDVYDCVDATYPEALRAGFSSQADVGLYCLFRYHAMHAPAEVVGDDLVRFAGDANVDAGERRYRLKAHLDHTGFLPFGVHESIVPTEAA